MSTERSALSSPATDHDDLSSATLPIVSSPLSAADADAEADQPHQVLTSRAKKTSKRRRRKTDGTGGQYESALTDDGEEEEEDHGDASSAVPRLSSDLRLDSVVNLLREEDIHTEQDRLHTTVSSSDFDSASPSADSSSSSGSAKPHSTLTVILSWISLLIAVFSMAAVGPMFLYLQKRKVPGILAITWRQIVQCVCLIPPTIIEHRMEQKKQRENPTPGYVDWWKMSVNMNTPEEDAAELRAQRLAASSPPSHNGAETPGPASPISPIQLQVSPATQIPFQSKNISTPFRQMVWISLCWGSSVSLWVISLPFSSAARASLYSSLYPLMISAYLYFWRKVPVSLGEFGGILVCLLGISTSEILSSIWPDTQTMAAQAALAEGSLASVNGTMLNSTLLTEAPVLPSIIPTAGLSVSQLQVVGDFLCIVGSCFIGANVIAASPTRKVVPLFAFSLVTSIFVLIYMCLASLALEHTSFFSMDPLNGVWGFMADTEMFVRMCLFGFVVGMIGILGFNFSFSTVQLLDPGISGVMSAVFGVEGWPTLSTYIGVTVVTIGIFQVVWYQMKREKAATAAAAGGGAEGALSEETPRRQTRMYQKVGSGDIEMTLPACPPLPPAISAQLTILPAHVKSSTSSHALRSDRWASSPDSRPRRWVLDGPARTLDRL